MSHKSCRSFLPGDGKTLEGGKEANFVKSGDTVILYAGHSSCSVVQVEPGKVFGHRHGQYRLDDLIGVEYGAAVLPHQSHTTARKRKYRRTRSTQEVQTGGYTIVLPVTPELWARGIDTRTQIIFSQDNCLIVSHLYLKPGSVVVESGTGSAALTMCLARAVGPNGKVHTFEYNEKRYQHALADTRQLGLDSYVYVNHRDVYKDGFGSELNQGVDAVVLDLPNPWLAIPHAAAVLKPMGRICTFSPCIEQVQRAVLTLGRLGFSHVTTITATLVEHRVATQKTQSLDLFAEKTKEWHAYREKRVNLQSCGSSENATALVKETCDAESGQESQNEERPVVSEEDVLVFDETGTPQYPPSASFRRQEPLRTTLKSFVTRFDKVKGHTGYLTFAYAPLSAPP